MRELLGHRRGRDLRRAGKVSIDNVGEGGGDRRRRGHTLAKDSFLGLLAMAGVVMIKDARRDRRSSMDRGRSPEDATRDGL